MTISLNSGESFTIKNPSEWLSNKFEKAVFGMSDSDAPILVTVGDNCDDVIGKKLARCKLFQVIIKKDTIEFIRFDEPIS